MPPLGKYGKLLLVPFMVAGLAKDNTGEFKAVVKEASDITPPPFAAQDLLMKQGRFMEATAAPKPKPKPRPRIRKRQPRKPSPQAMSKRFQILQAARSLLGIPYVYGGESRSGIDCSGFTQLAYAAVGIHLPRVSNDQIGKGVRVSNPQPGDLVYWSYPHNHVMIYYGGGLVIGAHHTGTVSSISPLYGSPSFYRMVP